MKMKKFLAIMLAMLMILSFAACGESAPAESGDAGDATWEPSGSIDFVCPYSAGGGSDVCARTIADVMKDYTSATAVVQNLSGGGGMVGTSYVVAKAGDDMTLITYAPGQLASAIVNSPECNWDKLTQLCVLALEEQTLCVQAGKFADLNELIAYSQAHPGEVTIAGTTIGNEDHMCVEMLNKYANAGFTYVTYDSAGDIATALLGGHITGGIMNPSECTSQVNAGDFTCLCSFGENDIHYITGFESVPTAKSYGYDINFVMFRGVAGAPGMSDAAKAYWVDLFTKLADNDKWVKEYVNKKGLTPAFMAGDELEAFLANQYELYHDLAIEAGLITK